MTNRIVRIILRGDIGGLTASMAAAGKSVGATADRMTAATKESKKFQAGLTTIGRTAGRVGLVASAGLGAIVVKAAQFDKAMSAVQAATHETAANMEELRAAAIKAGADTVFSAGEAAGAIESLAKAGVSTADILGGGLAGALDLAAAGGLEVADAADIAATALTQFKLSGEAVPHVADLLAAAAGKAQGDVTDMGMALKQSGLVASQMGLSIEETTGTLAAFASAGLLGSDAGTSFRTMLLRLANPSAESAKLMKKLGITAYDAQGNFIGMSAIAEQLGTSLGKQEQSTRDAALATIFGSDAIRAASVLYSEGAAGIDAWIGKVDDAGYAAETAGIRLDNLAGDLEQLKGSLETALIGAGEGSQAPLRELVQNITKAVNAFNDLPPAAQNSLTGLLAITALTGGALWFGAAVINKVAQTRLALTNLGTTGVRVGTTLRTALKVGAILEGLNLLDDAIDAVFHHDIDGSNLGRSLDALAQGRVTGELKDKFGADLKGIGQDMYYLTSNTEAAGQALSKLPIAGGFLGGPVSDAKDRIHALDDALAQLVESGRGEDAAQIFSQFVDAAADAGVSVAEVEKAFKQYEIAVGNSGDAALANSGAAHLMNNALNGLIDPTTSIGAAAAAAAEDTEALAKALEDSRKAADETARQFVGVGESVDDAKVSLSDWIDQLREQADALTEFTNNARRAGKRGLREGLIAELEAAGPAGALRMKQLADGTDTEIKRANRAWAAGQRAIAAYVDQVGGVPPSVATDVKVNSATAEAALKRIIRQAADVPRTIRTDYIVNQIGTFNKRNQNSDVGPSPVRPAAGGRIVGPGTATSDSIPAMVSNGEYVVRAAAVDRYGTAIFDSLNALRFASGGVVDSAFYSRPTASSGGGMIASSALDYERFAAAVSGNQLLNHRGTRAALEAALRAVLREMPVQRVPGDLMYGMAS